MTKTVKETVTLSKRGLKMFNKPLNELQTIAASGSLSASAANFEVSRRAAKIEATNAPKGK